MGAHWAREVQAGIRDIKPPVPSSDLLLLGYDHEGLAVVSHTFELEPGFVKILAAARALRCRGMGFGDVIMEETLARIPGKFGDAIDISHVLVFGLVHRSNAVSQELVDRHQFFYYGDDDDLQEWFLRIEVDRPPIT